MTNNRFTLSVAVYLLLIRRDNVLLLRRFNTGWSDGRYSLIAGHIDGDERLDEAMCREAKEEAGIILCPNDLEFCQVLHRKSSDAEYIDFFFTAEAWEGEPHVAEPDKCDLMAWFPLNDLPSKLLPYVAEVIKSRGSDRCLVEVGWER